MEPDLGIILLDQYIPKRKDMFLQTVRERLLAKKKQLEIKEGVPLILQYFPAKIIEEDGKRIYTRSDPTA